MHETMHFKGILKNPNTPKLILIRKQREACRDSEYSVEHYNKIMSNPTFYNDFLNKMNETSTEGKLRSSFVMSPANNQEKQLWGEFS